MPIKVTDMMRKKRTIQIDFQGEPVMVTYRTNAVTGEFIDRVKALPAKDSIREQIAETIESWDVLDDAGQMWPLTVESLKKLPDQFNAVVITAIAEDMEHPGDDEKKG